MSNPPASQNINDQYYQARYVEDAKRRSVWRAVVEDIQGRFIDNDATVLELGCGYGDFISQVKAARRIAVDIAEVEQFLEPAVTFFRREVTDLSFINDGDVDVVFCSNLFEHLSRPDAAKVMHEAWRVLRTKGRLIALQPNFRLCYREYFDDYTHETIFTDTSLADMMAAQSFRVIYKRAGYLPFSMKERLPKSYWLTKLYLMLGSPIFAKQMLIAGAKEPNVS